jgi:hypothetical protein
MSGGGCLRRWPAGLAVAALHLLVIASLWQALRPNVATPVAVPAMVVLIVAAPSARSDSGDALPGRAAAERRASAASPPAQPQAITVERRDSAVAAEAPPTTAPGSSETAPLDLDAARAAAVREAARGGRPLVRELPQRDPQRGVAPLEADTPLGEQVARARRPDCRYAYAEAGLLAAIPLLIDAFRDNGCSWTSARDVRTIVD